MLALSNPSYDGRRKYSRHLTHTVFTLPATQGLLEEQRQAWVLVDREVAHFKGLVQQQVFTGDEEAQRTSALAAEVSRLAEFLSGIQSQMENQAMCVGAASVVGWWAAGNGSTCQQAYMVLLDLLQAATGVIADSGSES